MKKIVFVLSLFAICVTMSGCLKKAVLPNTDVPTKATTGDTKAN